MRASGVAVQLVFANGAARRVYVHARVSRGECARRKGKHLQDVREKKVRDEMGDGRWEMRDGKWERRKKREEW